MKRLNRKGFTLVELLAVIVILAIVVGITLVTVLPSLKKARQESFELTANTVSEFLEKQYQAQLIGDVSGVTVSVTIPTGTTSSDAKAISETDLKNAGVKPSNYVGATWYINTTTGRACVVLTAATRDNTSSTSKTIDGKTEAGEFYDVDSPYQAKSTGC